MPVIDWLYHRRSYARKANKTLPWARRLLVALSGFSSVLAVPINASTALTAIDNSRFFVSAYGSRNSPDRLMDILFRPPPEFRDSYAGTLALSYLLLDVTRARVEWENNLTKHYRMQDHWEFNTAAIARWMRFPWDDRLDSRVALGSGLSYAAEMPYLEPRTTLGRGESAKLLHFMVVEKEFVLPNHPQWSAFARIHHRSGMFGLFSGVRGGSNFVGLGVRYRLGQN